MRPKTFFILISMLSALSGLNARITQTWSYQEMFDKADLIVIAEVVSTKDTQERIALQDVRPPVPVIGVVTDFRTRLIFKGSHNLATFQLHHYRFQSEDDRSAANSPELIDLSGKKQRFLLFLTEERNGMYAPLTGQT